MINYNCREKNTELTDEIKFGEQKLTKGGALEESAGLEMIPTSVKEKLLRLQHENKRLKEGYKGGNNEPLQAIIDDLKEREKSLEGENRKANQKIMELESKLEEGVPRVPGSRQELELKLSEANKKVQSLQETLQKKDVEIHGMEERYKKYIEKAKSVIKTLDPKGGGGSSQANSGQAGGTPEVAALRGQLTEKDRLIETMEHVSIYLNDFNL